MAFEPLESFTLGECMYCRGESGNNHLTTEHVIPKLLGGTLEIKKGTCEMCRKATHGFESKMGRDAFWYYRLAKDYKLSKPKDKPKKIPLRFRLKEGGEIIKALIPLEFHPTPIALPRFTYPGLIDNRVDEAWPEFDQQTWMDRVILHGYPAKIRVLTDTTYHMSNLCRMVAKIAHGLAVLKYGIDGFKPYLVPIIRGTDEKYTHLVGCIPYITPPSTGPFQYSFHDFYHNNKTLLIVRFRIFCDLGENAQGNGTPHYLMVAGELPGNGAQSQFVASDPLDALAKEILGSVV